MSMFILITV